MKVGDLVRMSRGVSFHGIVLGDADSFGEGVFDPEAKWIWVYWPDYGRTLEKSRDVERVS